MREAASKSQNWRERLSMSRNLGKGFAAPGGEFTRALYEWALTDKGNFLGGLLIGRRIVELGSGMMPYGYALASTCRAKNFVAVEPFYGDVQLSSVLSWIDKRGGNLKRIPFKVETSDMLEYLSKRPDGLLCMLACGIEDCILPGLDYRRKVEGELSRVLESDAFFISSQSDLYPLDLRSLEISYPRPSNPRVFDRLRLHGRKEAFERYGDQIEGLIHRNYLEPRS